MCSYASKFGGVVIQKIFLFHFVVFSASCFLGWLKLQRWVGMRGKTTYLKPSTSFLLSRHCRHLHLSKWSFCFVCLIIGIQFFMVGFSQGILTTWWQTVQVLAGACYSGIDISPHPSACLRIVHIHIINFQNWPQHCCFRNCLAISIGISITWFAMDILLTISMTE